MTSRDDGIGALVSLWSCNGSRNQQWNFLPDGQILNVGDDLCMSDLGQVGTSFSYMYLESCTTSTPGNQEFETVPDLDYNSSDWWIEVGQSGSSYALAPAEYGDGEPVGQIYRGSNPLEAWSIYS